MIKNIIVSTHSSHTLTLFRFWHYKSCTTFVKHFQFSYASFWKKWFYLWKKDPHFTYYHIRPDIKVHYIICWHSIEARQKIKKHSKTDWICHKKVAAETKQFSGPVPRKQHTLSHTSHNVRFKQTFLHFNVLAKKNFLKSMSFHKTRNILIKSGFKWITVKIKWK